MRSTFLRRSFAARSALLALGALIGAPACLSIDDPVLPPPIGVGGSDPCPNGCEDTSFEASSTVTGFAMCTSATASQDCFDGDPCTKDLCLFGGCIHAESDVCHGPGAFLFAEGYSTPGAIGVSSVAAGPDGTTVVATLFSGEVFLSGSSFGTAGQGLFLSKLDGAGQPIWRSLFAGAGGIQTTSVAVDGAGGIVLTGSFREGGEGIPLSFGGPDLSGMSDHETVFVAKLDADGNHLWSKAFPGSADASGRSVAVSAQGTIALGGTMSGSLDFGGGPVSGVGKHITFVTALDAQGSSLWSRVFNDENTDANPLDHRLAFSPAEDLVVAGSFFGAADVGGGPIGVDGVPGAFVTQLDPFGATVWSEAFPAQGATVAVQGAAVTSKGDIFVSGAFSGAVDFGAQFVLSTGIDDQDLFVVQLGAHGKVVWSRSFGDEANQTFCTVAAGAADEPLIAGTFSGAVALGPGPLATTSKGDRDVFVGGLDSLGGAVWGRRFGDFHAQGVSSFAVDAKGSLVLGGAFEGALDFGGGALVLDAPGNRSFVARLAP